jgi:hypothetical protein
LFFIHFDTILLFFYTFLHFFTRAPFLILGTEKGRAALGNEWELKGKCKKSNQATVGKKVLTVGN